MSLSAEAIAKIEELSRPIITEVGGDTYAAYKGGINHIRPCLDAPTLLPLTSLDALVRMVETEAVNKYSGVIYIEAAKHCMATCFTETDRTARETRMHLYEANATDVPGWSEDGPIPFESAMIAIRTRFQPSTDTEYLLRLLSDISNGAKITFSDNGIATSVVTQRGVALQGSEAIRPIVKLKPYRTFQELDQPASDFHIRVSERGIRFIEADGGMWKLAARRSIANYLSEKLDALISDGKVVVML